MKDRFVSIVIDTVILFLVGVMCYNWGKSAAEKPPKANLPSTSGALEIASITWRTNGNWIVGEIHFKQPLQRD